MLTWRTAAGTVMAVAILLLLVVHTLPITGVTVDQTTIGLLIMMAAALLLPDLTRLVGPGGWEADFQRNVTEAERGLAQSPLTTPPANAATAPPDSPDAPDQSGTLMAAGKPRWPMDAGLCLANLRVTLEDRLRGIDGVNDGAAIATVLERLARQRKLSPSMHKSLEAFIKATNAYLDSRRPLVPASVTRALAIGEELLRRLTAGPGGV